MRDGDQSTCKDPRAPHSRDGTADDENNGRRCDAADQRAHFENTQGDEKDPFGAEEGI